MANSGINKHQVKKARDALIAKRMNPSIDAVRVELGNTGSKATIHRYLKELAEEGTPSTGNKVAIGDTLASMVEGLAAQLHQEAQQVIEEREASLQSMINNLKSQVEAQGQALASATAENQRLNALLAESEQLQKATATDCQMLRIQLGRLEQQLVDKDTLLAEKDTHIRSLEEKHQHAREALEHYRQSVKDQRDQDQRRHEHQVQQLQGDLRQLTQTLSLKQTDITQLNKDNARLTTELADARRHAQQLDKTLRASELKVLEALTSLAILERANLQQQADIDALRNTTEELQARSSDLNTELVSTKVELSVKNQLFEKLGQSFRPQ